MGRVKVGGLALIAGAVIGGGALAGTASARITGKAGYHCPPGAFCIYPTRSTWKTGPEKHGVYYSYGAHNLHSQYGYHLVYNNQYPVGGVNAGVSFCAGYNGGGGVTDGQLVNEHWAAMVNLTPVNSITLWLYRYSYTRAFERRL